MPDRLILRAASTIRSRRQKFLWKNRIPLGALSLFAGRGGVGKSSFAIWLAVEAQNGRLEGDLLGESVSVLYVSVEDNWETQMIPRLSAAGAKMDTFYKVAIGYSTDESTGERIPSLPEHSHLILQAIEESGAKLVILDPITSTIQGDDHKRDVVRAVLDPLTQIAGETDAVIVGIMHFNKGVGNASDKLSGSHAYRDAARSVFLFARDEDEDHVVMSQDKGNYAEVGDLSLAYRLMDTAVNFDDGDVGHVARVEIIGDTNVSVAQIINRPQGEHNEATAWISRFMTENGGRVPSAEVIASGKEAGFSESALKRARDRVRPKIVSRKIGMGGWVWVYEEIALPEEIPAITEEPDFSHTESFAISSGERTFKRPFRADRFPT
ncbi:hypothetical protein GY24_10885 [Microterricola pindariensis]|uniref:AAA+ ATPase domain-containing protein n=1 Tax=Microterricola pindariensis TaxID=478010 RepID=A0ABX5AUG4_9MICO|nr:hypothetical protein GY24_10885 [Microterricola pindariensis]